MLATGREGKPRHSDEITRDGRKNLRYEPPKLTRHGTIVELTFGEPIGQVETGGIIPNVFASIGTG